MTTPYAGLQYISSYDDRHGKPRVYYRRSGRRIALPQDRSREECLAAYYAAAASFVTGAPPEKRKRPTLRGIDFEVCINRMMVATKSRGREHDLTPQWLRDELARLNYRCSLTGLPFSPERTGSGRNPYAPSIDRRDNGRGYTIDNVRIVLASVNVALSDWGDAHFDTMCRAYVAKQGATV